MFLFVFSEPVYKKLQERDGSLIEQILECDKKGGDAKVSLRGRNSENKLESISANFSL